ncbi:porin [soil metagenome]
MNLKTTLSLLALAAASGNTLAQSQVTISGTVDAAYRYLKNGSVDQSSLVSGSETTSKLAFIGTEDLGGGLKAGFWLETQLSADNGVAGVNDLGVDRFWHRRSTVSLIDSKLGELRLGRAVLPTWSVLSWSDPFGTVGVGAGTTFYGNPQTYDALTRVRADNAVQYFTPSTGLGGFYANLAAAPGEGRNGGKYVGGRIGYKAGPFEVTGAYSEGSVIASDVKTSIVGVGYNFGFVNLLASYQNVENALNKNKHLLIGANKAFGQGLVRASYERTEGAGLSNGLDADKFAVGYTYSLSKRTAIYTTAAYLKNKGSANFVIAANGFTPARGSQAKSTGFELGLRHNF